jgi:hypothetical protein
MTESKREITAFRLWSQTLATMRMGFKDSILILLLGCALPSLFLGLLLRKKSHDAVSFMQASTDAMLSGSMRIDYKILYNEMGEFATSYLFIFFIIFFLFAVAYVALNLVALRNLGVNTKTESSFSSSFKQILRLAFPRVFVVLFVTFLLSAEKVFLGPIRLFSLLSLLAVCLIITENRGAFSAIWQTVTLKFVRSQKGFGFTVLWLVFSTGALLYIYEHLMNLFFIGFKSLVEQTRGLDSFFSYRPEFLPCSLLKLILDGFQFIGYFFILFFLVNFMSCLYVETVKTLSERS